MRTFTIGSGLDRRYVVLDVSGARVIVTEGKTDGAPKRSEKELKGAAEARAAYERMARELLARGYAEQTAGPQTGAPKRPSAAKPAPASNAVPAARQGQGTTPGPASKVKSTQPPLPTAAPKPREPVADDIRLQHLFDDDEGPAVSAPALAAAPIMPPMARRTDAEPQTKKVTGKRKKKKAKGKAPEGSDALDPRVIGGVFLGAAALVAFMGWFVYDSFLKPASIVGVWQGSRLDYEVSQYLTHSSYRLVLDAQKRATLIQDGFAASGTYTHKGNQLTLKLVDDEGGASDIEYRVALGRATMDLFEPESGTKVVQLVRQDENPAGGEEVPAPAAPVDIAEAPTDAAAGEGEGGEAGDAELVSVEFSPKDGAFRIRHPEGWKEETGSRPDNTYSWARFTKGSGKIQIFADVAGSLMSGSNFGGRLEEGSPSAPVQTAHELYREKAAEEFSDYRESEPTLFKGSRLGEGRIAAFTASGGGLFGSKLRGYRVTHLTNDRRVTILCSSPDTDFEKLKPVFLAACRSLSN